MPEPAHSRSGLRLPPALRPGDRIAVLTPSWPGPDILPTPYTRGLDRLRQEGFDVVEYRRPAAEDAAWVAGPARDRADDLHAAFTDPSVRGIICSIGGNFSAQILPWLDLDLIAAQPKVFCGYSDITVLHLGLHRAGLLTFYGPAVIPQWGAVGGPMAYTTDHFRQVTGVAGAPGAIPRADVEVHDLDFDRAETTGMPLHRTPARPRRILRDGTATGSLLAVCLPSARFVLGTAWAPEWAGRLLVLETPEPPYSIADADAQLTHLGLAGVFDHLAGLIVCKPYGMSPEQADRLDRLVLSHVEAFQYPVVTGFDGGHTDPLPTFPLGAQATLTGDELTIDEPCVTADREGTPA